VELSDKTLRRITHDSLDTNLFVLYYSTPCPALFLELEAVARTFRGHKNITVAKIDVLQYPAVFEPYAAHGSPLLVFYGKADPFFGFKPKQVIYADVRIASAMVRFVNRKCGLLEELVHVPGMIEHPHDAATADSTSLPGEDDRDAPPWVFTPAGHA